MNERYGPKGNFVQADEKLADEWSKINRNGRKWTPTDIEQYRLSNNLTWHEMNDMMHVQLVPTEVNARFGHLGGVGEYHKYINQFGGNKYD